MKSTFDELKDLIDYIQSVYTEITDEWLRETPTKTNLKNALVADIDADGIIYKSKYVIFFIGYDTLALDPIIIKYIHLAVIKITVNHIFLLIC